MPKTLIIVRHAHRDKSHGRELDNGVSKKGSKQTEKILEFYKLRFGKTAPAIYSSGKLRCVETVEPLAKKYKTEIVSSALLMEQGGLDPKENSEEFVGRIREFVEHWKDSEGEVAVASTHGDWVPAFFEEYFNSKTELKKGGWAEVSLTEKKLTVTWIIQEFY